MTAEEEAVAACRETLAKSSRERDAPAWAGAQNALADALFQAAGGRDDEPAYLRESIAACREALTVWSVERGRDKWVLAENNLARALSRLGEYDSGTALFEEAIARCDVVLGHVLVDDAWDEYVRVCRAIREHAARLLALRSADLEADFYLYPTEQSGRRGALFSGATCLCLTKTGDVSAFRAILDVGPRPMRSGEMRRARFCFEQGAIAAASLRKAKIFYLRDMGIFGEATVGGS